ncbi:MAG TPA: hypothetical protein VFN44_10800 [Solirubrobacteraceae bacterium]|nr:hypothetical protein [Solirubrobacteraceae bacterium]
MNPQAAGDLVDLWLQAHDDPSSVVAQRGPVSRAIRELAPDGRRAGIGQTPTGPAMAVLLDTGLLVFHARPMAALDETSVPVRCRLLHLTPEHVDLEVTERFEDRPDFDGAIKPTRVHLWHLHTDNLDLRIDGSEVVHAGVETGPDLNEQLGRAVATKLGWQLP